LPDTFQFQVIHFGEGLKYLGNMLKPNGYKQQDWSWLISKVEKRIQFWCNHWLSRSDRLTLVKLVLEAIPVYWQYLAHIPKGILEKIRKICFRFLWSGKEGQESIHWMKWKSIARPKEEGGWDLKNI
jgi:hypothetical protein